MKTPHPEIDDSNFKGTLWAFKQSLALKMPVHYGISLVNVLMQDISRICFMSPLGLKPIKFSFQSLTNPNRPQIAVSAKDSSAD